MEDFYRIRRLPPYVFEEVNRAKATARNGGADIIDRAPTAIPRRAALRACAAPKLHITSAASG
jgi:hypothetical protein